MKIAITQPNFMPWIGYFDLLEIVDLWICYDNVGFSKGSFVNRNKIKIAHDQWKWITVPLERFPLNTPLNELVIDRSDWFAQLERRLDCAYRTTPCFHLIKKQLLPLLMPQKNERVLSRYNLRLINELCGWIGLKCNVINASEYFKNLSGDAHSKLLFMLKEVGAVEYYNFENGINANLYKIEDFNKNGIKLYKQNYQHPQYPQVGNSFVSHLSIIDLLFNIEHPIDCIREGQNWIKMN